MRVFLQKYQYFIVAFIAVFLTGIVAFFEINRRYEDDKARYIQNRLLVLESTINSISRTYEDFAAYIFEKSINTLPVLELIKEANQADDQRKAVLRQQLYEMLQNDYQSIQRFNYRQLHFHLKNGDSFLRFHAPDLYGDNLLSVRESIRIANVEKRYTFGFEEGRIFNGFRFVFPLFYGDEHIGSVEVSISLSAVVKQLIDLYPENRLIFMLKREVVESTVFDNQQSNYSPSPLFSDYMVDNKFIQEIREYGRIFEYYQDESLINEIRTKAEHKIHADQAFGMDIRYQNQNYLTLFLPLKNIKGEVVGYYVSIVEDEGNLTTILNQKNLNQIVLLAVLTSLTTALLFFNLGVLKVKRMAETDLLTGVYNRRYFLEIGQQLIEEQAKRASHFCILMLDVDHFKMINDQFGHAVGDVVLVEVVKTIKSGLRASDLLARWGGEEFVVLLKDTSEQNGVAVAERVRKLVESHSFEPVGRVTISGGVACFENGSRSLEHLINRADAALYQAKSNGRNCVVYQGVS